MKISRVLLKKKFFRSRGQNLSKSIFEISPPPLFVTNRGGVNFLDWNVLFLSWGPKNFFLSTRGHFNGRKNFFWKKKPKWQKNWTLKIQKLQKFFTFHFFLYLEGKKSFKNFNFHFTTASWVFIRFWRLYPQNFRNWLCFSNLIKNLKNCGLNKPKIYKIDFGLFGFFLWGFTAKFCILNHKNLYIFQFLESLWNFWKI